MASKPKPVAIILGLVVLLIVVIVAGVFVFRSGNDSETSPTSPAESSVPSSPTSPAESSVLSSPTSPVEPSVPVPDTQTTVSTNTQGAVVVRPSVESFEANRVGTPIQTKPGADPYFVMDAICEANPTWCTSFAKRGDDTKYKRSTIQIVPNPPNPFEPGPKTSWRECVNEDGTLKPGCKVIDLTSDEDMRTFLNDLRTSMMSYDSDRIQKTPMGSYLSGFVIRSMDPLVIYHHRGDMRIRTIKRVQESESSSNDIPLWIGVLRVMYEFYIQGKPVPKVDEKGNFGLSETGLINIAPFLMLFVPPEREPVKRENKDRMSRPPMRVPEERENKGPVSRPPMRAPEERENKDLVSRPPMRVPEERENKDPVSRPPMRAPEEREKKYGVSLPPMQVPKERK